MLSFSVFYKSIWDLLLMQRGVDVDSNLNMNREERIADLKFGESVVSLL